MWAEMDYDDRLAAIVKLARDGNTLQIIARVLGTSNVKVWQMVIDHSVIMPAGRPGHAVPDEDDEGIGGGDQYARKFANWLRASEGARRTRTERNENNMLGERADRCTQTPSMAE